MAFPAEGSGNGAAMSPIQVRPLGGAAGCLGMILFSVIASVVLTLLVNYVL